MKLPKTHPGPGYETDAIRPLVRQLTDRLFDGLCACCARPLGDVGVWCADCEAHVGTEGKLCQRTYEVVQGKPCPFTGATPVLSSEVSGPT